jgi:hypothetical protein
MTEPYDWKAAFQAWERAVGKPLEELVQTEGFADALAAWVKGQSDLKRQMDEAAERWLHVWNLPSVNDIKTLQEQVQKLQQEVRELRREVRRATAQPRAADEPAPEDS